MTKCQQCDRLNESIIHNMIGRSMNMKKVLGITGCIFLLIYLIIAGGVYTDSLWVDTLDLTLIHLIQGQITEAVTSVVSILTGIGGIRQVVVLTIIMTAVLLIKKMYVAGFWLSGTMAVCAVLFTMIMKMAIGRERPDFLVLATEQSPSFPSGHTTAATIFYGLIGICLILAVKNLWKRIAFATVTLLIITFVMLSRIYLGAHFPTDVLGGFCFGMASVFISVIVYQSALPHLQKWLAQRNLHDRSPSLD